MIFDPLNQRYLTVHPDGKPGASFRVGDEPAGPPRPLPGQRPPGAAPMVRIGGLGFGMPRAADARGRLYFEGSGLSMGPNGPVTADNQYLSGGKGQLTFLDCPLSFRTIQRSRIVHSSSASNTGRAASADGWLAIATSTYRLPLAACT